MSTRGIQANKERYQAQLIANGQAERIRLNIKNSTHRNVYLSWTSTTPGCIKSDGTSNTGLANCTTNDGESFDVISLYQVKVECIATCSPTYTYNTYKIRVEWDSLTGGDASGKDNVELYYGG
jgi:hypothetical protein